MKTLILLALAVPAAAQEVKPCPAEFPAGSVKIAAPAGWVGVAPQRLLLSGADVVEVAPENGALIGKRRKTRAGDEVTYGELGSPAWLACRYGDLALAQRLPAGTDRCIVTHAKAGEVRVACHVKH